MAVDRDAAVWEYPDRLREDKLSGYFYALGYLVMAMTSVGAK